MKQRAPRQSDLQQLEALLEPFSGWTPQRLLEAQSQADFHVVVSDEPAAAVLLARRVADEVELLLVSVAAHRRNEGLAAALMKELLGWADGASVFLEVAEDNMAARRLYEGFGFQTVGRRPDYYGPRRPALVMSLSSAG